MNQMVAQRRYKGSCWRDIANVALIGAYLKMGFEIRLVAERHPDQDWYQ